MTILGKHTVEETTALYRAVNYQYGQVDAAFKLIAQAWIDANKDAYNKLSTDWTAAKQRWLSDSRAAMLDVDARKIAAGLAVPDSVIPSEDAYQKILADSPQGADNSKPDSIYDVNDRIQKIRGVKTDFSNQPSQMNTSDVDQKVYKGADTAIKTGEKGTKSIAPYVIGAGVLFIGGVFVSKVYL